MEAANNVHDVPLPLSPPVDVPNAKVYVGDLPAVSGSHISDEHPVLEEIETLGTETGRGKDEEKNALRNQDEEVREAEDEEEEDEAGEEEDPTHVPEHDQFNPPTYHREADGGRDPRAMVEPDISTTPPTPPAKSLPDSTAVPVAQPRPSIAHSRFEGYDEPLAQTHNSLDPTSPTSAGHKRSLTISKGHTVSVVLISSALETIAASKEAKRSAPLRDSTQKALEMIRANQGGDRPREIFEPLRLACETSNEKLQIASLDCISKLISYSFFAEAEPHPHHTIPSPPPSPRHPGRNSAASESQAHISQPSLVDLVAHTITSCHNENTPETVSLQIVKALLSLVLSPTILVHHSSLLKAVRTVYNVFLLSADPVNQMVAQGGLTQMVHHVFTRCRHGTAPKDFSDSNLFSPGPLESAIPSARGSFNIPTPEPDVKTNGNHTADSHTIVSEGFSSRASLPLPPHESEGQQPVAEKQRVSLCVLFYLIMLGEMLNYSFRQVVDTLDGSTEFEHGHDLTPNDLFIKDAFLVFRALCKLTMKPLNNERFVHSFHHQSCSQI